MNNLEKLYGSHFYIILFKFLVTFGYIWLFLVTLFNENFCMQNFKFV